MKKPKWVSLLGLIKKVGQVTFDEIRADRAIQVENESMPITDQKIGVMVSTLKSFFKKKMNERFGIEITKSAVRKEVRVFPLQ